MGSGFYTYALTWGVNQGLLDRTLFEPAVRKAWVALVSCVDADGKLTHVQPIGADPKKFAPESTEVYGVGSFLLAGNEVYRMAVLETAHEGMLVSEIKFENMPIAAAIKTLAGSKYLNLKYAFDPQLGKWQQTVVNFGMYELHNKTSFLHIA